MGLGVNLNSASASFEPVIWARLFEGRKDDISPDAARYLLSIEFGESDRVRMQELADRSEAGLLTEQEQNEFDSYLHIGNLLAVMQSKARIALRQVPVEAPRS